jgi:hypothetical protein
MFVPARVRMSASSVSGRSPNCSAIICSATAVVVRATTRSNGLIDEVVMLGDGGAIVTEQHGHVVAEGSWIGAKSGIPCL